MDAGLKRKTLGFLLKRKKEEEKKNHIRHIQFSSQYIKQKPLIIKFALEDPLSCSLSSGGIKLHSRQVSSQFWNGLLFLKVNTS